MNKKILLGSTEIIEDFKKYDKIIVLGEPLNLDCDVYYVKSSEISFYKHFYKLLQEITKNTLIICNEIYKQRYSLEMNCLRRYCLQTNNVIIKNYFPFKKNIDEFMGLYDLIQDNPFWKEQYRYIQKFDNVFLYDIELDIKYQKINTTDEQKKLYELEKEKIISEVKSDPNIIPRRLLRFVDKMIKRKDKIDQINKNYNFKITDLKVDLYYLDQLFKYKELLNEFKTKI